MGRFAFHRPKAAFLFVLLLLFVASYLAYQIYFLVVTYKEFTPICLDLNEKYKGRGCGEAKLPVNPKRQLFQELLKKWISLVKESNVSYVLSSGSLLGQYRTQDIIPWDYDLDVLVSDDSFTSLQRMITTRNFVEGGDSAFHFVVQPEYALKPPSKLKRRNCNNKVVNGQPDHCSFIGPMARLIKGYDFLDIFGVSIKDGWAYEAYEKRSFRVSDLFPALDCRFMDILTKCPRNSKSVLETYFHALRRPCRCVDGEWKVVYWDW